MRWYKEGALVGHCRLPRKRMSGWRALARRSEGCIVDVDERDVWVRHSADPGYSTPGVSSCGHGSSSSPCIFYQSFWAVNGCIPSP